MNKIKIIISALLMTISLNCLAEPHMKLLHAGDKAPYEGIILDAEAQATILGKMKKIEEQCSLDKSSIIMLQENDCKKKLEIQKVDDEEKLSRKNSEAVQCNAENKALTEKIEKINKQEDNKSWYVALGFGGGVILSILTFFAGRGISK